MKSKAAFLMSARILFEESRHVYFWTFTWVNVYNDWEYPKFWNQFARRVLNIYPMACGLRVLEAHTMHGLHYHLLVNKRLSIQLISRLAKRWGIGRIGVERATWGGVEYLAKYLIKYGAKLHGVRRWGSFGSWTAVRTNDIEIDSPYMRSRRQIVGNHKVTIGAEHLLRGAFDRHGHQGMGLCFEFLKQGKTASACLLVSAHVQMTAKGGLKYTRLRPIIPFSSAKYKSVTM